MIKGIVGVGLAALIFAIALFLILNFIGFIAIIAGFIAGAFIIAAIVLFILLFALGFVFFFAAFYYLIEKKPVIQENVDYTLSMEKGKDEK